MASQKLIKEDHFLRAPQGCLRSAMMKRAEARPIGICSTHPVHQGVRTHILAASDYSLVKEHFCKRRKTTFVALVVSFAVTLPLGGGGS
jgi:hypothetical protein